MQQQVQQQRGLVYGHDLAQCAVEHPEIDLKANRLFRHVGGVGALKKAIPETVVDGRVVVRQNEDQQQALVGQRKLLSKGQHNIGGGQNVLRRLAKRQHGPQRLGYSKYERSTARHPKHIGRHLHLATDKVQESTHQCVAVGALVNRPEKGIDLFRALERHKYYISSPVNGRFGRGLGGIQSNGQEG